MDVDHGSHDRIGGAFHIQHRAAAYVDHGIVRDAVRIHDVHIAAVKNDALCLELPGVDQQLPAVYRNGPRERV